jgi:hypothetical protein
MRRLVVGKTRVTPLGLCFFADFSYITCTPSGVFILIKWLETTHSKK